MWKIKNNKAAKNQQGFTLIEMAIVIAIIGMVMVAATQLYSQRVQFLQFNDTQNDVSDVTDAIADFLAINGRYPCPASLTAVRGSDDYGRETDCDDGVMNTIAANGVSTTADLVRIGAVPFKELNLEENQTIDGYHNRLIYAVTETQAVQDTFNANNGQITVLDDQGNNVQNDLHFIVYSTGANGAGGFTREGQQTQACVGGVNALEDQNCDFADSTFVSAQTGTAITANEYDDLMSYNTNSELPKWQTGEDPDNQDDISMKLPGSVGLGPGAKYHPDEEVDIAGVARVQDDPDTPEEEGKVQSTNICEYTTIAPGTGENATRCFPSELIGGDSPQMECPAGKFMTGIRNNQVVCEDNVIVPCRNGYVMTGINSDGTMRCNAPPPLGCGTARKRLCGEIRTLHAGRDQEQQTLRGGLEGNRRWETYICQNQSWRLLRSGGLCSCDEGPISNRLLSCSYGWWSTCGQRYTGTKTEERYRSCPSGSIGTRIISDDCVCIESSKRTTGGCPWGYNTGRREYINTFNCTTRRCSGNILTSDTCSCTPRRETRWPYCTGGLSGRYQQERFFSCPNGEDNPGTWSGWTDVAGSGSADRCRCAESSSIRPETCPEGQEGHIATNVELTCPDPLQPPVRVETPIIYEACHVPPPIQCEWEMIGSGGQREDFPLLIQDGTPCSCESDVGNRRQCSKTSGSSFRYGQCNCVVKSGG